MSDMDVSAIDKSSMLGSKAFIVGYTGSVGRELVKTLVDTKIFAQIVLIGRRNVDFGTEPKFANVVQKVVDFDKIADHKDAFEGAKVGFCALGTTRARAGKDGFLKVDHDYIVNSAHVAKEAGCEHFNLVSSQGAKENSWFLYMKTKGQVEREVTELGFKHTTIYRPAFLQGERDERRFGEMAASAALAPVKYLFPTAMTVPTSAVSKAMIMSVLMKAKSDEKTAEVIENKKIHELSGAFDKLLSKEDAGSS